MKKIYSLIIAFSFTIASMAQLDCANMCVTSIAMNTEGGSLDVIIVNGSSQINYPIVTIIANGDTVGNIDQMFYIFAQLPGQTTIHNIPTSLTSVPIGFTCTVVVEDYSTNETCVLEYPCIPNSIITNGEQNDVSLFPNPGNDQLRLTSSQRIASIAVFDYLGKKVMAQNVRSLSVELNMTDLSSGNYMIEILMESGELCRQQWIRL